MLVPALKNLLPLLLYTAAERVQVVKDPLVRAVSRS